jgi:hypothetical protein
MPPSSLICHSMVSKRQSAATWCGGTGIRAASNLSIEATPERCAEAAGAWATGYGGSQTTDSSATLGDRRRHQFFNYQQVGKRITDLFQAGPAELDRDALPFGKPAKRPLALLANQLGQYCYLFCGRRASAIRKIKTALAIATVAAIRRTIVTLLICTLSLSVKILLSRVSVRRRLMGVT